MSVFPYSLWKRGIERKGGFAENPILVGRLGERKRLACVAEDFRQSTGRIWEIRTPRHPRSTERINDLAEKRLRRSLTPFLGPPVRRRDLEEELFVFG